MAVLLSAFNMYLAAEVYLSLHGWLWAVHEPSGMQSMLHAVVTAPVVLVTTIWLFYLSKSGMFSSKLWKINLFGMSIPAMSVLGVVPNDDIVGLVISVLIISLLLALYTVNIRRKHSSV